MRPSLDKKIWDFLDRLLAIPLCLSLFFQRLSYILADLSQNSHVSAHKYDLVLILPHHYKQFSHVPCASSGNDFHKSFYCFYVNGIIFLPHMSNEFLICDYSWTKKPEKLKCFGSCGQITSTTWKMRFVSLSKHITVAFLPNLGKHKDGCIFALVRNTNMHSSNERSGARVNEDVGLDSSLTCEACVLRAWISRRPLAPCKQRGWGNPDFFAVYCNKWRVQKKFEG